MDPHSLVIDRFRTRLALVGQSDDGPGLEREVARVVRDLLPPHCETALGTVLGERVGVVRIERLHLALSMGREGLSAAGLADRLARELARGIADALAGRGRVLPGVAAWPDLASFAAAYVANRLGLVAAPEWAFADFRPLTHLAPAEAAVELIAARPAILRPLVVLLADRGGAARLAAALPEPAVADLVARLAASAPPPRLSDEITLLASLVDDLPQDPATSPGRAALTAALADPLRAANPGAVPALFALARIAVALGAVARAVSQDLGRPAEADDLDPAALVHLPPSVRDLVRSWVGASVIDPAARTAMITALRGVSTRPASRLQKLESDEPVALRSESTRAAGGIPSRIAGLGLLLPAAVRHGLPDELSHAAYHRVLVAALAEEDRAGARLDPLLAALAPFDPRGGDPVFPPVPDRFRAVVPEAFRPALDTVEGASGWAGCLLHAFAATLPGFEASSSGYLRAQFLAQPGRLVVAPGRMTLLMAPLPLSVVLRYAGIHGWTGRLAHAGNVLLRIEIEDG